MKKARATANSTTMEAACTSISQLPATVLSEIYVKLLQSDIGPEKLSRVCRSCKALNVAWSTFLDGQPQREVMAAWFHRMFMENASGVVLELDTPYLREMLCTLITTTKGTRSLQAR